MSRDILAQVVADLIPSPTKFSFHLDETPDVFNSSQLAVFVRYVKDDVIKEDFLFCKPLTTTTQAADVKKLVHNFFKNNSLSWDMVSAVCSPATVVEWSAARVLYRVSACAERLLRVRNPAMNTSCFSFRTVSSHLSVRPQLPAHGHIPGLSHGAHHHPYSKNVNLKNLKNQCTKCLCTVYLIGNKDCCCCLWSKT
ncbi:hypothetical protein FHG87_025367 [Trinorchestia longiramus]|nr:hypothetical protein FHG87_025367 [Trinorchestia longiramus]